MSRIINLLRVLAVLPLAVVSLYIYKLALQPAIHQFYKREPDFLLVYALVLVAAFVHAVLVSGLVLKFYYFAARVVSIILCLTVLTYCIQLAWLSSFNDLGFWLVVFFSYVLMWIGVMGFGRWFIEREQQFDLHSHEQAAITTATSAHYSIASKNKHS